MSIFGNISGSLQKRFAPQAPQDPLEDELSQQGGPVDPYQNADDFSFGEPIDFGRGTGGWGYTDPYRGVPTSGGQSGQNPYSGGSFQDWFMGAVAGRPYNQETLLGLEGLLQQSGSRLTPANSLGERTKIWDPTINDWVRVGFGEGHPVWIPQGWGQNGPSSGGTSFSSSGPTQDPRIRDAIYRLLEEGFKPVNPNSPDFQARYAPVSASLQRGAQRAKDAAAERLAFQGANIGGAGGALDAESNKIMENLALGEGQLTAQLVTDDLEAQREQVYNALQFAQGEERMALQAMLSQLDNELRRYGIDTQNQQFYDDLGYRIGRDEYLFNSDYWS